MNALQDHAFAELVRAWNRREAARTAGDIRALVDARTRLDEQRLIARQAICR